MKYIIVFLLLVLCSISIMAPILESRPVRPEILIIRETTESQYGKPVIILDYMVGGIATNAIFYHYQMDEYARVMQYLKDVGRLRYASPMITPFE